MTEDTAPRQTGLDWDQRFIQDDAPWERQGVHPALSDWKSSGQLDAGQSIYIPGCGRSEEPLALAQMGLIVTALDLSPTAIQWQQEVFQSADQSGELVVGDGLNWRPATPFDRLYEQTFLCAIHPDQRKAYEAMAHDVLKPGGKLLALFMQKRERGGPPFHCDLSDMRLLFSEDRWAWSDPGPRYSHPHLSDSSLYEQSVVLTRL